MPLPVLGYTVSGCGLVTTCNAKGLELIASKTTKKTKQARVVTIPGGRLLSLTPRALSRSLFPWPATHSLTLLSFTSNYCLLINAHEEEKNCSSCRSVNWCQRARPASFSPAHNLTVATTRTVIGYLPSYHP